jgi:multiple sugar transport system substrate-binding protein
MKYLLSCLLCGIFVLSAGCNSLEPILASLTPPTPSPTPVASTPTPRPTPTSTAPASAVPPVVRVWLPAQFNPAAEEPQAEMLAQRLAEFETMHPGMELEIRIKKAENEGEILHALSVTSAAAPDVLPDLVLLSRPDLESAAQQGLLHPIDGLSTLLDDPNWYGYARQLGHVQNTGYGLPFLGDALVLIYYPEIGQIVTWDDVLTSEGQFVFPAGNPRGLIGLSLYVSAGGEILDSQGLPTMNQETLIEVLQLIQQGRSREVFPPSLANVTNEAQALQIYRTGNANKAIVSYVNYRPDSDGAVIPLPGLGETPFSYASGWIWALAGHDPEKQQLAVELAEYLVAADFIGEWTLATGYLPTRPSSVEEEDLTMIAILESAQPIPPNDVLAVLGPIMQQAMTRVLNGEDPEEVAADVLEPLR